MITIIVFVDQIHSWKSIVVSVRDFDPKHESVSPLRDPPDRHRVSI